ncbi:MAG: dTDP-4-dehydrorhamnose reductase [Clostridia bacterium]|nr:dTDP-4-dehydrorhamnose reductase [Clostridia bacterium]MBR5991727.1 dTDP-4-dehydrorhamnose reductase [Clostridia bacterium]
MKVLVTGVSGQLGYDVAKELKRRGHKVLAPKRDSLDLLDQVGIIQYFEYNKFDAVIHCAAYTAVDKAQEEKELCSNVNVSATRVIAKQCASRDIPLLYVSTDYVFPGTGSEPYETGDRKGPLQEYGISKLAGEEMVKSLCKKYYIVRTSWVFGKNGRNFVRTVLRLADLKDRISVVDDQVGSPTYTKDLAPLLCDMIETDKYGVYHATNEGFCSFYEFACEIISQSGKSLEIKPTTTDKYNAPAKRPLNSRLSKKSLDDAGFSRLPDWHDALSRYLTELGIKENT